ncbi:MAG: hypothetical protein GY795_20335 [Desulfobacterales bacterium]|nr:hypothetical protein [Desulfobacterales bacterium]
MKSWYIYFWKSPYYLGIDIGINNLATLTSNIPGLKPLILLSKVSSAS